MTPMNMTIRCTIQSNPIQSELKLALTLYGIQNSLHEVRRRPETEVIEDLILPGVELLAPWGVSIYLHAKFLTAKDEVVSHVGLIIPPQVSNRQRIGEPYPCKPKL
jgi:hypothetical protein